MTANPNPNPATPLPLLALDVHNYKRLRLVQLKPEASGITQIRGLNEQGKSSLVDAADVLFFGLKYGAEDPIRHGELKAVIRGDFGDLIVQRVFTDPEDASKSKLTVTNANGAEYPRPSELLEKYLRERMDPIAFVAKTALEQVKAALKLVELPIDLEAHQRKLEAAEVERRDAGREVIRLEGTVKTLLPQVAGAPEAEVDVTAAADELAKGERVNAAAEALLKDMDATRQAVTRATNAISQAKNKIQRLEEELAAAKAEMGNASEAFAKATAAAHDAETAAVNAPTVDLDPIRSKIANARELNRLHAVRQQYLAEVKRRDQAVAAHEATERAVQSLRQERLDALNSVAWPSEGLGYDPENNWLTLGGVPFKQASGAQKLIAAADIAMAQPGAIRILLVDELSSLDPAHLAALDQHLRARQYQMIAAKVDPNRQGPGIWIEDGEVRGGDAAIVAEA